jgi:lysophospholipase L1-like esterase
VRRDDADLLDQADRADPLAALPYWTPAMEAVRDAVNRWLRHAGAFDGVIDFGKVLADPSDPTRFTPSFDSGDGQHPNDAGHAALARAIPLSPFRPTREAP